MPCRTKAIAALPASGGLMHLSSPRSATRRGYRWLPDLTTGSPHRQQGVIWNGLVIASSPSPTLPGSVRVLPATRLAPAARLSHLGLLGGGATAPMRRRLCRRARPRRRYARSRRRPSLLLLQRGGGDPLSGATGAREARVTGPIAVAVVRRVPDGLLQRPDAGHEDRDRSL